MTISCPSLTLIAFNQKSNPSKAEMVFPIYTILKNVLNGDASAPKSVPANFEEIVKELKSRCEYDPERRHWRKVIELPGTFSVTFVIEKGPFDSTTFHQSEIPGSHKDQYYFKFYAEEQKDLKAPFLKIRSSQIGDYPELMTLESSPPFSGNSLKIVAKQLIQFLKIDEEYVHDGSHRPVTLSIKSKKSKKLELGRILAVASDDGRTWYEKSGYSVVDFTKVVAFDGATVSQSKIFYDAAVRHIRSITLADLGKLELGTKTAKPFLSSLCDKYLPKGIDLAAATLHDLAKAIFQRTRSDPAPLTVESDIYLFQERILEDRRFTTEVNEQSALFNLAREIIRCTFILKRDSQTDVVTHGPNPTLSELAAPYITSKGLYWGDIIASLPYASPFKRAASSTESDDVSAVCDEVTCHDSPEDFIKDIATFDELKKRQCSEVIRSESKTWMSWITIPEGWQGDAAQRKTFILLEMSEAKSGALTIDISEALEDDNVADTIDTQPILVRWQISDKKNVADFKKAGRNITTSGLQRFVTYIDTLNA